MYVQLSESDGAVLRRESMDGEKAREEQTELAEWVRVGPKCWQRRMREWGTGE